MYQNFNSNRNNNDMRKMINDWNFRYSLGTPVMVFWEEKKRIISTLTRSKADILDNKPIVYLVGFREPCNLNMVKPLVNYRGMSLFY